MADVFHVGRGTSARQSRNGCLVGWLRYLCQVESGNGRLLGFHVPLPGRALLLWLADGPLQFRIVKATLWAGRGTFAR